VIRALVLDVDGVLTDGLVRLDEDGRETKTLFFRDLDALGDARRAGLLVALLTGEATPLVDVLARRLEVEHVRSGAKDKVAGLEDLRADLGVAAEELCYVGDADRDAPALALAGLGLAPADATSAARGAADAVLDARGGRGAVAEAVALVLARNADAT
jgi:3-deoxy-D-manno-octulosonate 8-phosphate phosphatase (KDO 8-P phosphatase)